jgi:SAM-dependent methyltransferase
MHCRHCAKPLEHVFVDLGTSPPSNSYLSPEALDRPETYYPLKVMVCDACWLVQTVDYAERGELFSEDYAYFSSFSKSWLAHAERYVSDMAARLALGRASLVVEVACNDGYLLRFVKERGIPSLGIEPTRSTAAAARALGIEVVEEFFGEALARRLAGAGHRADLMVANNVLAHVPDINDFVRGFAVMLKPEGVATFEFPHLHNLIGHLQFDTIYHEHFSYLSLNAVERIFRENGLHVFDVEEIETHGGSLRVFAQRSDRGRRERTGAVARILALEAAAGMLDLAHYRGFQARVERLKDEFLSYLLTAKAQGLKVAGYGAAAKGNTLLNFAGVRGDLVRYVVDLNPAKQGRFLPGSRIPIVPEEHLKRDRPDRIVILPWNLREEIARQLAYAGAWGARLATAVPALEEFPAGGDGERRPTLVRESR